MRKYPLYPLFLAPIPMLVVLTVSLRQVNTLLALRLIPFTVLAAGILFLILGLALRRDWYRAALISSLVIVLSHLLKFLVWWSALPALALAGWLAWKARPGQKFTAYANIVTLFTAIIIIAMMGWQAGERDWFPPLSREVKEARGTSDQPDIYFIILDSYTSHDVLLERFEYDNADFLSALTKFGFSVGDCKSPYPHTDLSLAASLNPGMDAFPEGLDLWPVIRHSEVRTVLEERGYQTIAFGTGFVWTEFTDADFYYRPPMYPTALNLFEIYYLQQTAYKGMINLFYDLEAGYGEIYRQQTLTLLAHLTDAATQPEAQFVFAHIIPPHPPFVFDAQGNPTDWRTYTLPGKDPVPFVPSWYSLQGYAAGYINQIQYVQNALLPLLGTIIAAQPDSIILIAGDHGPWFSEEGQEDRAILCAVYGADLPLLARDAFNELIRP